MSADRRRLRRKPTGGDEIPITVADDSRLESDYRPAWSAWKADQTPAGNASFLKAIDPAIREAASSHVADVNPLVYSSARRLALEAARTYDPKVSTLRTHMYNRMQSLKRENRQQNQIVSVPEGISLDRHSLESSSKELEAELGREPSDYELENHSGFSRKRIARIRQYRPAVSRTGLTATRDSEDIEGERGLGAQRNIWHEMIYDDLDPIDQLIAEHSSGMHGRKVLSNQDIAKKLRRSPGLISQRKAKIQKLFDEGSL